jgi:hypothetical protein
MKFIFNKNLRVNMALPDKLPQSLQIGYIPNVIQK